MSRPAAAIAPDPASRTGPYAGREIVLATMHAKERAIAPAFASVLGARVEVAGGIDTDTLGTFTGEIDRVGDMLETARRKARLGIEKAGTPRGLASEGAYGPHPLAPMLPGGTELLLFIDDERSLEIVESCTIDRTNFGTLAVTPHDPLVRFLERTGFPWHALVVSANAPEETSSELFTKGIRSRDRLDAAIDAHASLSADGKALVQTDMRAHMNPTRMEAIAGLAKRLAERLMCYCPRCASPGFGRTGVEDGLPCESCGNATRQIRFEIHACAGCAHTSRVPRADGKASAEPQYCDFCNP